MKVSIVGGGNVAFHFHKAFQQAGHKVQHIYVRNPKSVSWAIARPVTDLEKDDSELLMLAVSDHAIKEIADRYDLGSFSMVVHCSGAVSLDVFKDTNLTHYGVFYPLQTMSRHKTIDYSQVPLYIEANSPESEERLIRLGKSISKNVDKMNSEARMKAHVAAVFASNFTNYLLAVAEDLLQLHNLDRSLLYPLLDETIEKFKDQGALVSQTGPAIRGDNDTIKKHLENIEDPTYRKIYQLLTDVIQSKFR